MTRPATHIWRLLKWGRTLARHGALRGIEEAATTPAPVRRLARIARFGTFQPSEPDYASAFRAIGPAAIKLGQTLATRPDLVGEIGARNLLMLQDALPPMPFATVRPVIEAALGRSIETLYSRFDEEPIGSASVAQVYRATTIEGREVAVKVLRPGVREKFARDIDTYEWAAAISKPWAARLGDCARALSSPISNAGRCASSTSGARRRQRPNFPRM